MGAIGVSEKARIMSEMLQTLLDTCFPVKTLVVKDCEDPWITMEIMRLIKKRKRVFKKYGRNRKWKRLKKIIAEKISAAKEEFFKKGKEKAKTERNSAAYFKVANGLKDGEAPKQFNINMLRPDLTDKELADSIAQFFNKITSSISRHIYL